jgi:hypothetical protein
MRLLKFVGSLRGGDYDCSPQAQEKPRYATGPTDSRSPLPRIVRRLICVTILYAAYNTSFHYT